MGFKTEVVRFSTVQENVNDFLNDACVKELSKQVRKHLNTQIILTHSIHFIYISQQEKNLIIIDFSPVWNC
jgi:hypothetical protein